MLVGGTGLYLDAIRYDMNLGRKWRRRGHPICGCGKSRTNRTGQLRLHEMLEGGGSADCAEKLHPNDVRRVMRALENLRNLRQDQERAGGRARVAEGTIPCDWFTGLSQPRENMYARINARVDEMMAAGLVDEVKSAA